MNSVQTSGSCGSNCFGATKMGTLFLERGLFDLASYLVHDSDRRQSILKTLMLLQEEIYVLDLYGETTWRVRSGTLRLLWKGIEAAASKIDMPSGLLCDLLGDIKRYQSVELGLRRGRIPISDSISSFYFLKTCDVRLMRAVLLRHADVAVSPGLRRCLDLADVLAEVYDDMVDLVEDGYDFNCNRFLLSRGVIGDKGTHTVYASLLADISDSFIRAREELDRDEGEFVDYVVSGRPVSFTDFHARLDWHVSRPLGCCRLMRQLSGNNDVLIRDSRLFEWFLLRNILRTICGSAGTCADMVAMA